MMQSNQTHQKLKTLARSYVPEWQFSTENPDVGSVTAILIDDMLSQSEERLAKALHKHKLQYLNLFDRLKQEPIESAKGYVRFTQVAGMERPVLVPKGTRLFAEDTKSGERLVFETTHSITTTQAELMSVYTTDQARDHISCLYDGEAHFNLEAFGRDEKNEAEHILLLGYDTALEEMDGLSLGLKISTADPQGLESAIQVLTSEAVEYSLLEKEGERAFSSIERRGDLIWLTLPNYTPQKVKLGSLERYVICVRAKTPLNLRITSCELVFAEKNLYSDEITCRGITQNVGRFSPFGSPMEIYAECGIECRSAFARRGADIEMSFDLGFEVVEQKLPETAAEMEYKIIMKQPVQGPKIEAVDVRADYVLIEYLSETGWKRLIADEHTAMLMNGSAEGRIAIRFICPQDMNQQPVQGGRIRMRLMRSDNLYRVPCKQLCPIITNLQFSYTYEAHRLSANYACTRNNFHEVNVTGLLQNRKEITLFYSSEVENPAMYLGFSQNLEGMPLSLYFAIQNDEDIPLDYSIEYLTERGFEPLTIVDNTGGMLYSGTILLPIGRDGVKTPLFQKDLWWIRFRLKNQCNSSLPRIKNILTNLVRAENQCTFSELFFKTQDQAGLRIQLSAKNLISVRVFVNEEDGNVESAENWIEWTRKIAFSQTGRCCSIDFANGVVEFDKNAFAPYPLKEGHAAVRVEYQSYQGSAANVSEGAISAIAESIRYISHVSNPLPAYGGYDGYNEASSASIISNIMRTRGRAVTNRDYFDIISQAAYGVRRIKCVSGVDRKGKVEEDIITVALLIDEYDKGSHIFSAVKDTIRNKLLATSTMLPMGKSLVLCQPYFIRFSARIWLDSMDLEEAYHLQCQTEEDIFKFIDPLEGGFDGAGWEIGDLPTVKQLLAWLKMKRPGLMVTRIVMSAQIQGREYAVDDDLMSYVDNPFVMAVNGDHTVYVQPKGQDK